jgi:hypothetical protein
MTYRKGAAGGWDEAGFELRISNIEYRISKNSSSLLANRYSAFDIQSWQIRGRQPVTVGVVEY